MCCAGREHGERCGTVAGTDPDCICRRRITSHGCERSAQQDSAKSEHESAVNGRILIQGADIGLKMQDTDLAKEFIKASNKAARWLYDKDHDPEDPNRALKLFWPSTQAWKELVLTAARISNKDATDLLADIPDPEIRALETVTLAGDWLGVPIWRSTSAMVSHKNRK